MTETAQALARAVDAEFRTILSVLHALAASTDLEPGRDLGGFQARRAATARALGIDLVLIGPPPTYQRLLDTRRPFGAPLPAGLQPAAQRGPLRQVVETGVAAPIGIRRDAHGEWITGMMVPVMRDGRVIRVLAGVIPPSLLAPLLTRPTMTADGFAVLLDADGRIVARSRAMERFLGAPGPEAVRAAHPAAGEASFTLGRALEGEDVVLAVVPLAELPGWRLAVLEPRERYLLAWQRPMAILAFGSLCALAVAAAGAYLLSRRLARPAAALAAHAAATAADTPAALRIPIPDAGVREYAKLRTALLEASSLLARRRQEAQVAAVEAAERRALLQSILDALPDAVFVKDLEGRYLVVNRAGLALIGRSLEDTIGRVHGEDLPPERRPDLLARHARVLESGLPERSEADRPLPGGLMHRFETLTVPWSMPGRPGPAGTLAVSRDVTEQRRTEANLRRAEAALTDLVRRASISALASGLAHELNQPLAAAANYLNAARRLLLAQDGPAAPGTVAAAGLAAAEAQIRRTGEIIRRLRDFMAGHPVTMQPEPPGEVVEEAARLALAAQPEATRIPLALDLPDGLPHVPMDRVQVQQVLVNLLRNAFEALDPPLPGRVPEVVVSARLRAGREGGPGVLEIAVTDNGPGLPEVGGEAGFQPLRTRKPGGMGLGLAICRDIAAAHGGTIRLGPGPGGTGTRAVLSLPRTPLRPEGAGRGTPPGLSEAVAATDAVILGRVPSR
jgi:PAS domain S-box-containing protein